GASLDFGRPAIASVRALSVRAERKRGALESKQAPPFDSAAYGRYAQGERGSFSFVLSAGAAAPSRSRRHPSTPRPAAATLRANGEVFSFRVLPQQRAEGQVPRTGAGVVVAVAQEQRPQRCVEAGEQAAGEDWPAAAEVAAAVPDVAGFDAAADVHRQREQKLGIAA